jgi:hypothetical protein
MGWLFGRLAEGVDFFGEIDSYRTPGDTPSASYASRHAELVDPGSQLVCQPHAIAVFDGGPEIFSMDISMFGRETGIPDPGMV